MHTKAFPFQHVTNYPIAWLHTRSGEGGRGSYKTSRQAQICCSVNTLLKSHLAPSPGCLVTRCNRSPSSAHSDAVMLVPGPPLGFPNGRATNTKNHHALREVPPIAESCHVSWGCEITSTTSNQCPEGHQTRLKHTKTKEGGIMAWAHDFYKYSRSSHCCLSNKTHEHCNKILKHCPASV